MKQNEKSNIIKELSKMPPIVIETAYLYALNYMKYGEDVTQKWLTAAQNASALEKAYKDGYYYGYYTALQRPTEEDENEPE